MPITDILRQNCEKYGNEICLVEINPEITENKRSNWKEYSLIESTSSGSYRREITWNVFDEKANRFANLLLSRGVEKGDKVAILLMNSLEWLPIYFGILKIGALAVPLNFRYAPDEIQYCLKLADVHVLIFGTEFIGRIEEISDSISNNRLLFFVGEECPAFAESYTQLTMNCSSQAPDITITDDDDAAIYFSSGTTGFPKAILHKHTSLMHACYVEQAHHHQTHEDIFLCIPPLYHTGAKMHWFGSFLVGGKGILLKGTRPKAVMEAVSEEKCTIVWLLVPWAQDILDALDRGDISAKDYELSQWRLMHIGAQPVPPSLIRRWQEYFPTHEYDTNYGLSESIGPGSVHLGIENTHKIGAIGKAGYGWELNIVDENGIPVSKGDIGELILKGPGLMTCYYKNRKATEEVLKDGWLYTGDMAKEDEDGFVYLVDRKKDVIISGGENLYPVQIEDFIRKHECVKDVAVIGLPHKRLGEAATAIVEIKEDYIVLPEELEAYCQGLPRYKRPHKFIFADVPRNPTGKIEKPKLRELYCGEKLVESQSRG